MLCIWELQWELGGLNVKGANPWLSSLNEVGPVLQADLALLHKISSGAGIMPKMHQQCIISARCRGIFQDRT